MILYQLSKWMEERTRLRKRILETSGDASDLLHRKEQVEETMMRQANRWLEGSLEPVSLPEWEGEAAERYEEQMSPPLV
ncbi:hypothetical protein MJA45_22470 [Paenibacillus aurantius]|uniref:Uncharacterized protein n=1 Tax=Paenibacillus aurantius TaxID=2918900 RepID=A0AA96LAT2_9BACL|nr:hypothetical protein [Paenibacillus aurantius]WJH35100.1 hypothetical protein N6H14_03000 [Paenibacillus sp. CC-CFT747]WNQ10359.1 hypothetical protein MJA45_22470 [Paenibacillus aurantius]